MQSRKLLVTDSAETLFSRRRSILCSGASLVSIFTLSCGLTPSPVKAEEKNLSSQEDEGDNRVARAIKSLLDPNEKTKSGKVLPKAKGCEGSGEDSSRVTGGRSQGCCQI